MNLDCSLGCPHQQRRLRHDRRTTRAGPAAPRRPPLVFSPGVGRSPVGAALQQHLALDFRPAKPHPLGRLSQAPCFPLNDPPSRGPRLGWGFRRYRSCMKHTRSHTGPCYHDRMRVYLGSPVTSLRTTTPQRNLTVY